MTSEEIIAALQAQNVTPAELADLIVFTRKTKSELGENGLRLASLLVRRNALNYSMTQLQSEQSQAIIAQETARRNVTDQMAQVDAAIAAAVKDAAQS